MSIARCIPVVGSLYALMRQALGLNVETQLGAQELSVTAAPDRRLVVLGHEPVAGFERCFEVADEAAMLALHTLDSTTLLTEPTFVAPGDSCLRADDPGWRWHCIANHGQDLSDWERRPLAGALAGVASGAQPRAAALTSLAAALTTTQAGHLAALAVDSTVGGRALLALAAPTELSIPTISPEGAVGTTPVSGFGGASSSTKLWELSCVQNWHSWESKISGANGGAVADGDAVRTISDLGQWSGVASQHISSLQPTWVASAVNGIGALLFPSGGYHQLTEAAATPYDRGLVGDRTVFVLAKRSDTTGWSIYCGSTTSGADSLYSNISGSNPLGITCGATDVVASSYVPDTGWHVYEVRARTVSSVSAAAFYVDGALVQTVTFSPRFSAVSWALVIGNYAQSYGLSQGSAIYLGARVMCDGTATDAQLTSIREYLMDAAGLS